MRLRQIALKKAEFNLSVCLSIYLCIFHFFIYFAVMSVKRFIKPGLGKFSKFFNRLSSVFFRRKVLLISANYKGKVFSKLEEERRLRRGEEKRREIEREKTGRKSLLISSILSFSFSLSLSNFLLYLLPFL